MATSRDLYAVIGNPVEHSKSPLIHARFAEQTGQAIDYGRLLAEVDGFNEAADSFREQGGKGLNVTVPFKLDACDYADELTERARLAQAVNTLSFAEDGKVVGDNSDGAGLVADLQKNLGVQLHSADILILGAGGAARGVLGPLLAEQPRHIVIANRSMEKAILLAEHFHTWGEVCGCGYEGLGTQAFDLIINATSMGLSGQMPTLPSTILKPAAVVYDMAYGNEPTAFVKWGQAQGASQAADGLGMLVEQAAESFFIWRGTRPDTRTLLAELSAR
ncbi:MAG: shikimate dehydrogenase [Nevskiales bacterium]